MPYNSYFPASYQPLYQPSYYPQYNIPQNQFNTPQTQQQTQPAQNPVMTSNLIWVQGEAGAKSYLVAPNTTVQLWDSERQTIYLKSADATGMPSIKVLDYTIREEPQNNVPLAQNAAIEPFATKKEVNTLAEQITALRADFDGLSKRPSGKPKKEVTDDE